MVTLAWVGCVADTPEVAAWFGDDIAYRRDSYGVDLAGLPMLGFVLRHVGAEPGIATPPPRHEPGGERGQGDRARPHVTLPDHGAAGGAVRAGHRRVRAAPAGVHPLGWQGGPDGVGGEAITQAMRLFHLADTVEVYHHDDGIEAAMEVARARRGTHFDPAVVDVFCAAVGDVLVGIDARPEWEALIEAEPGLQRSLTELELDAALEGVADFTDLRSPPRAGHSRGVADLAAKAGELCGLSTGDSTTLRRAALVHAIGMHGIPATILDKPGPLSGSDWERMRMRAYYTQRMLSRPPALARIGAVAAMATERLDGSGYHRGLSGAAIPTTGRILAAADVYRAMTEARPHRPSLSLKQASDELRSEVRAGRLAPDAVDAVLAAAGQRRGKRPTGPAGLTPREVEVLTLIARGASTRQVAQSLGITPKTAGTHIERIYAKSGASTRSTATLFAMRHGLLDTLDPVDL